MLADAGSGAWVHGGSYATFGEARNKRQERARTLPAEFDRFLMITEDGDVYELPDYDVAIAGLSAPETLATPRLAENLN